MALTEVLLVVAGIVFAAYLWCRQTYSYWQRKGIPYLKPIPFLGNTKDFFTQKNSFSLLLSDIYNDKKVSDAAVVGMYAMNKRGLVVREPELVKSVLIKDFNKFADRSVAADPHGDALGWFNLFFAKSPEWKEVRNKLSPVFTSGKIKQMYPLMLQIADELEEYLERYPKDGNSFVTEVREVCASFTTDLIATTAFGVRANSLTNPNSDFRVQGRKFFAFDYKRAWDAFVSFFWPNLVRFFRVKLFSEEFSTFLRNSINFVISDREKSGTVRNDLIDVLVTLKKEAASIEDSKHFSKNNDFLVAQAGVFFTAGFETSSTTMSFALYELAKHPHLQDRLRAEILAGLIAGKGSISYEQISSMEYLGMVVDEVLRLYPVLPFLDRQFNQSKGDPEYSLKPYYDCKLDNGTPVFIPVYALQRDPKYWENPDVFDPERFSNENRKHINPMTYMPFGTGPHNCIGSRIGLLQSKIGLVHLLKNHYATLCDKTIPKMTFDPKSLLLQGNGGIHLKVVNDNMYNKASSE